MNLYTNYKKDTNENLDTMINEMSSNLSGFDSVTLQQPANVLSQLNNTLVKTNTYSQPIVGSNLSRIQPNTNTISPIGVVGGVVAVNQPINPALALKPTTTLKRTLNLSNIGRPNREVIPQPIAPTPDRRCPANSKYIPSEKGCMCNEGYQINQAGTGCEKIINNGCPENSKFDSESNTCICKDGYVADSTRKNCIPDSGNGGGGNGGGGNGGSENNCPENSSLSSTDNRCHCNEGYEPNTDGSGCVKYSGQYTDDTEITDEKETDKKGLKSDNKVYYIAGGILAAALLIYVVMKKKK
jgi:hypothetical protein